MSLKHLRDGSLDQQQQWRRYLLFCGTWQASFHRFSISNAGLLVPAAPFHVVVSLNPDKDSVSVQHFNYYEPGMAPVGSGGKFTGREVDGLLEVDFGSFNKDNFQHPFGPASLAVFLDDCAVVAPLHVNQWPPKMLAMEFLALSPQLRERRRLVAVWKPASENAFLSSSALQLSSMTAMIDHEGQRPESHETFDVAADLSTWSVQRITLSVQDGQEIRDEKIADWDAGMQWETLADVEDIAVGVPRQLTPEVLLSGKPAVGLAWRRAKGEVLRVGVVYDEQGQVSQLVRELFCRAADCK